MATSVPPAFSFEMLSRLPANSFVAEWREFRPDTLPVGGAYKLNGASQRARFHLRGAPNEFLMNTHCYLSGSAIGWVKGKVTYHFIDTNGVDSAVDVLTVPVSVRNALERRLIEHVQYGTSASWNSPFHWFDASRESFNSDSLPWNDNQDQVLSHEANQLRYMLARRARRGADLQDLEDLTDSFTSTWQGLRSANANGDAQGDLDPCYPATAGLVIVNEDGDVIADRGSKPFNIPLGLYSNMINSHSVIPIGLMSSYSVNGYSIAIDTSKDVLSATSTLTKVISKLNTNVYLPGGYTGQVDAHYINFNPVDATDGGADAEINNLRIYGLVVKILDPAVMASILSLYEKQEQVAVGGVQFPLSLRMNAIAFRQFRYTVNGVGQHHFRLPGTDRSVRAYAWRVFKPDNNKVGFWTLSDALVVSRLETRIGSELPHPVVEDTKAYECNVSNFIRHNDKKSGALFSPLPYYQECRKGDQSQMDRLVLVNNQKGANYQGSQTDVSFGYQNMGVVSLENLDRREGDYSGSFQASGKDLTNVGAIDVFMTLQVVEELSSASGKTSLDEVKKRQYDPVGQPLSGPHQIVFMYAYDSVMEISPAGLVDVTNAVL